MGETKVGTSACHTKHISFLPAKPVRHDAHTERAHHAANTKDGDGDAPDHGTDPSVDFLAVTLHPSIIEKRSQFLMARTNR